MGIVPCFSLCLRPHVVGGWKYKLSDILMVTLIASHFGRESYSTIYNCVAVKSQISSHFLNFPMDIPVATPLNESCKLFISMRLPRASICIPLSVARLSQESTRVLMQLPWSSMVSKRLSEPSMSRDTSMTGCLISLGLDSCLAISNLHHVQMPSVYRF